MENDMDVETIKQLNEIIHDPIEGPEKDFDYIIDEEEGVINVDNTNIKISGIIMRKVNKSGLFKNRLIPVGKRGDYIILDFDTICDRESVFDTCIGINKEYNTEIKLDDTEQAIVYFNNKRYPRIFKNLASAKRFVKKMDKELKKQIVEEEEETIDDLEDLLEDSSEQIDLDVIL